MEADTSGEIGIGAGIGVTIWSVVASRRPRRVEEVVEHEAASYGAGGRLKKPPRTPITIDPPSEAGQEVTQRCRAGGGVELVAALHEPRRALGSEVGPERDHEHVGVVGAAVGHDALPSGVDGDDGLLADVDVRVVDLGVAQADVVQRAAPDHDVELVEAEDERVVAVDQGDLDPVAEVVASRVLSSRPPKPAPRTTTRVGGAAEEGFGLHEENGIDMATRACGPHEVRHSVEKTCTECVVGRRRNGVSG